MEVFSKTSSDSEQLISRRFLTEHNTEETPTTFFYKQKPNVGSQRIQNSGNQRHFFPLAYKHALNVRVTVKQHDITA